MNSDSANYSPRPDLFEINAGVTETDVQLSGSEGSILRLVFPQADERNQTTTMTGPTREEIDAKLETIEVRMDGRVAAIQASVEGFMGRLEERAIRTDERFARVEDSLKDTKSSISSLKTTIIVTALSTVAAIVFGIAAFNATLLSNMVASFESGRNVSAVQAEVKRQSEETASLLKEMRAELEASRAEKQPAKAARK